MLKPSPDAKNVLPMYKYLGWLYPAIKLIFPDSAGTLAELGMAMIKATISQYPEHNLEVKDIKALAAQ